MGRYLGLTTSLGLPVKDALLLEVSTVLDMAEARKPEKK